MNKAKAISAAVIVAVVLVGIYLVTRTEMSSQSSSSAAKQNQQPISTSAANTNMNAAVSNPSAENSGITVPLSAQNGSGETGTAVLTDEKGKTKVTVNMTGEPNGATQPSHIHVGACATPGPAGAVKYPLSPLVNGKAETTIDVSLSDLLKSLPLMINFHKSASEITNYTACGDIVSAASAPTSPSPSPSSASPAPAAQPTPSSGNSGSYGGY
ncbi:MAG: hypothetical protein WC643_03610 [Parcubacteria group bacterium]|jgi:hypothetical protein